MILRRKGARAEELDRLCGKVPCWALDEVMLRTRTTCKAGNPSTISLDPGAYLKRKIVISQRHLEPRLLRLLQRCGARRVTSASRRSILSNLTHNPKRPKLKLASLSDMKVLRRNFVVSKL